jgi:hypothetical protein
LPGIVVFGGGVFVLFKVDRGITLKTPRFRSTMLKFADYAAINLLFKNGYSKRAIAHLTNHDRETVNKVLHTEEPVIVQRPPRKHKLDAFREPLEKQPKAGCKTCDQLPDFLRSFGFNRSKRMVQQFVRESRKRQIRKKLTTESASSAGPIRSFMVAVSVLKRCSGWLSRSSLSNGRKN